MLDSGLEPYKSLYTSMYIEVAWLPCWPPRGQKASHQWSICGHIQVREFTLALKVHNWGVSGPIIRTGVLQKNYKKRRFLIISCRFFHFLCSLPCLVMVIL